MKKAEEDEARQREEQMVQRQGGGFSPLFLPMLLCTLERRHRMQRMYMLAISAKLHCMCILLDKAQNFPGLVDVPFSKQRWQGKSKILKSVVSTVPKRFGDHDSAQSLPDI